jgi:hypothetical protein
MTTFIRFPKKILYAILVYSIREKFRIQRIIVCWRLRYSAVGVEAGIAISKQNKLLKICFCKLYINLRKREEEVDRKVNRHKNTRT